MKEFARDLIHKHAVGLEWPEFLGAVALGERFLVETERFNLANGPIEINGVKAGEIIAIHVEKIEMVGPFISPNGGPFFEGMGDPVPIEYRDSRFFFPRGLILEAKPSVGNVAVLPEPTERILGLSRDARDKWGWRFVVNGPRGKHCHQDCRYLGEGAIIHLKAQVDGAGLCLADVHGYIGQGETAFAGIEVASRIQLRVERSKGWHVDWPLIETEDEIMVFCSDMNVLECREDMEYVDVVRMVYKAMREVVAARMGCTIAEANPIVATALDIRNCAIYGLANYIQKDGKGPAKGDVDIAIVGALPKSLFPEPA